MKKLLCVAVLLIVLTAFVACTKKGEKFVEPPTEVISYENGETEVFEVITQENGEAATEENGEKKYVPYDPPVTEKGGYIVTDRDGSTQKQSQTKPSAATEKKETADLDIGGGTTVAANGTAASQGGTTVKDGQTIVIDKTEAVVTATYAPVTPTKPTTTEDLTGVANGEYQMNGTLNKVQAEKLCEILEFENKFDEDLCNGDYVAAKDSLVTYIADIDNAIGQIRAINTIYYFVGPEVLKAWKDNILEAQKRYDVFLSVAEHQEDGKKDRSYYTAYNEFQEAYRNSLDAYYSMYIAAQKLSLQAG